MDFRVEITDPAIDDLAEIVSYIAQDNPEAASVLGNHLLDAAFSLAQTPHKGSPYRHIGNVRKLTVRPFKIFYRVNEAKQSVEVLRFWHSARREPKLWAEFGYGCVGRFTFPAAASVSSASLASCAPCTRRLSE